MACAICLGILVVGALASAAARDMCSQSGDYCFEESRGGYNLAGADTVELLRAVDATSSKQCCAACESDPRCGAWSLLHGSSRCRLLTRPSMRHNELEGRCTSGGPARPNFVFSFPDTLRAEAFGLYGNKVANVTPNVDRFASQGVTFKQAHVMHSQCSPSRCTMFTGRYMHVLGHRTQTHLIQDYEANYFRILKEHGYYIKYIGKNDAFSPNAFNLSVSSWTEKIGYASGGNAFSYPQPGYFSFLSTGSSVSGASVKNADYAGAVEGVAFLQESPPEPFVLFLPSRGAHPPYGAPAGWHNKFSLEEVKKQVKLRPRGIPGMPTYMSLTEGIPHFRNIASLTEDTFYQIQRVYLGMASYTDWIFGQLMAGLDAAPDNLSKRTAVFFSSDHGDFGGDYGLVEKWPGSLADVLTRVPLVGRIPGGAAGRVSEAPVQTADILETMLDMAKIKASFVRFGESLLTQLSGGEGDVSRFVYSEGGFYFKNEQMIEAHECLASCPRGAYCPRGQQEAQQNGCPRATMIRNATVKLVYRPTDISELYDLVADPQETQNLFDNSSHAALQADLTKRLLDWAVLTSDVTPVVTDPRAPPKFPHPVPPDPWARPWDSAAEQTVQQEAPRNHMLQVNGVLEV